ncbi:MAG: polysaccharide export protein [Candidatus Omnitrophica bacterium]|nr:polysaccharide export protein [Candidatus Omnitrophota bacterium]
MGSVKFLTSLGLTAVLMLGLCCISVAQEEETSGVEAPVAGILGEGESYTLGKEDIIEVVVRNQPEFSGRFVVGPDGDIQYKFVGDIKVEGLTKEQVAEILVKRLEQYVKVPEVSVTIAAYRSKFVYLLGELKKPGKYPMKGDAVSLRDAVVAAGLPTADAALRRTYVIKPDIKKAVYTKVDLYHVLYKGILEDDLTLTPGDLVVVPATVPSEINRALGKLLAPFSRAAVVEALLNRHGITN